MKEQERGWTLGYDIFSRYRSELMGLAMLWVLLYHVFHLTPQTPWLQELKKMGYLGVDIFIFLSALGLGLSLCRKKQSYGAYLKRRLVRVLPLYWLVTGLYGLFLRLMGETSVKTVAWTMSTFFYWFDRPNYFNWYIPGLLFFYLLAPACTALLLRSKHRGWLVAVISILVFPVFHYAEFHNLTYLGDVIKRIPVFLMGTVAGIHIAQGKRLTPRDLWLWATLPFLVPVVKPLVFPYYLPTSLAFAFGCVAVCLLLAGGVSVLPKKGVGQALSLLGRCSLEIYLLNVVIVREYDRLSALIPPGIHHRTLIYYAVTVAANIALGIALHYALERPMAWLSAKITGSASPSRPPEGAGYSAEDRSGR